jgi:hypothetical protein
METHGVAEDGQEQKHGLGFYSSMMPFLIILYALSMGPVAKVTERSPAYGVAVRFYWPIERLCQYSPAVERFYTWYLIDLWKLKY